jgi:predicted nucleic acid-binding protein
VSTRPTAGVTLDTGALLALDQPSKAAIMQARLDEVRRRGAGICVPVGAVAQAWRGPHQARLARLIKSLDVEVAVLTLSAARAVGSMCAAGGHHDVVDVHVALCARERRYAVVTSDPDDMARIDPTLPLIRA